MSRHDIACLVAFTIAAAIPVIAAQDRPALFFREDWTETPAALPVTAEHVSNGELTLALHGPGASGIKKSHHDKPADDPYYIWSGEAAAPWAVSLRHRKADVDLRGLAKVRWRARQTGFRRLHLALRLADGSWIVSEQSDGASEDWRVQEFNLGDLRWRRLDIKTIVEGRAVDAPDLSRVVEIGFTDLMHGGGTPASSRLDWIEVHGRPVPRP
jgi:hypothetical protein